MLFYNQKLNGKDGFFRQKPFIFKRTYFDVKNFKFLKKD